MIEHKTTAVFTVRCDECKTRTTSLADSRHVTVVDACTDAIARGWKMTAEGRHLCWRCARPRRET